jgi:hypothetical protein
MESMTDPRVTRWAMTWRRAAAAMAALDATGIDTREAVAQLMPAFALARQALPATTWSGLVEMRRLLDRRHG